jgi:hypothetical protein
VRCEERYTPSPFYVWAVFNLHYCKDRPIRFIIEVICDYKKSRIFGVITDEQLAKESHSHNTGMHGVTFY